MKTLWMSAVMLIISFSAYTQYKLSGKVSDANGEELPGAYVWLEGTRNATAADLNGNFAIGRISEGDYVLKASFVGYETYSEPIEVNQNTNIQISLEESVIKAEEVIVYSTRANDKTPTTFSDISNEELEERNLGQDLPFLLKFTPSVVVTSDAGNGVGYSGIRIRGSDPTRINVTVNGIPLNDSESHGVFWVNMPDFSSSVNNIQIQRGVGTSTNGAAAFGATINLQTDMPAQEAYGMVKTGFGSFNTWRNTVEFNTGLINKRWAFQGRLSSIESDGYIDRATSDLKSYYLSGGYYGKKTTVKALTFSGKEVTYQSWYGTPGVVLGKYDNYKEIFGEEPTNRQEALDNLVGLGGEYSTQEQLDNLYSSDRKFNYYLYDREVDDYGQDHYQLHFAHSFSDQLNVSAAVHYTHGEGYFEQYRNDDDFSDYGFDDVVLKDTTISSTDLIRRRWLDNDFIGGVFSINYNTSAWSTTFGGGFNYYDGDHFGEIIWSEYASNSQIRDRYYDNYGKKTDLNFYWKNNYQATERLNLFADLQVRALSYKTKGVDSDLRNIDVGDDYFFFNPKFGATFTLSNYSNVYASFAVANREPVRGDFVDAPAGEVPNPENLKNIEAGYRFNSENAMFNANVYYMGYDDQLVLTGALNDVGSGIRTNVPESYRAGIELVGGYKVASNVNIGGNLTLSQNKIKEFTEVLYDYGPNAASYEVTNTYIDTDIAFSPSVITGGQIEVIPVSGLSLQILPKYVGKQYLDNTSNENRVIDAYFITDLLASYTLKPKWAKEVNVSLMVNNVFDAMYESNGYTWGYMWDGFLYQQNNYYPQAGTNFLTSLTLKF